MYPNPCWPLSRVGTQCSSVGIVLLYRLYETYQLCLSAMKYIDGCSPSKISRFSTKERTKVSERIPVNIIQPLHASAPGCLESVLEARSTTRRGIRYHQATPDTKQKYPFLLVLLVPLAPVIISHWSQQFNECTYTRYNCTLGFAYVDRRSTRKSSQRYSITSA